MDNMKRNMPYLPSFKLTDFDIKTLVQPILCPRSQEIQYYETLSKISTFDKGNINNDVFFSIIDNTFIQTLALQQIRFSLEKYPHQLHSFNIKLSCLADEDFVRELLSFNGAKFALEISELDCYTESKEIRENLSVLQANNIEIWLDDYHRNNKLANMSLGNILWDRIKIDKSFLKHADQESIQALEYFLAPFCLHGLIFEGAEYIEHHKMLKTSHSLTQGYYYFRPSPINSLDSKPRVAESIKLSYAG